MQIGFYYDQTRCIACDTCSAACRSWNELDPDEPDIISIIKREQGAFPEPVLSNHVLPCYHCAEPRCIWVCPAEAITKNDQGVVIADRDKCRSAQHCGIIDEDAMGTDYRFAETESPCQVTCPVHLHVPGYVALIAKGRFKEALDLIREKMPLPAVCGRICLSPCETQCRRQEIHDPVAIKALKRFVADCVETVIPDPIKRTQKEKVAIVGSGPAGLAAANDLIRKGYGVTIYEAAPVAGGWLAIGIPEYRLPKAILLRDIDFIKALGVDIQLNACIGKDVTLEDLNSQGYDAVLIAAGCHRGQALTVEGSGLKGVMIATEFLRDFNLQKNVTVGKKVMVIGGGSVAVDAARTARRLGAGEVSVVCLECWEDIPASSEEVAEAQGEGVVFFPSIMTQRILGQNGKVEGVEFVKLRSVDFCSLDGPTCDIIEGTEHTLPADTVIFAVGQVPELTGIADKGGLKTTLLGALSVDPETRATNRSGVFAAGDVVNGPRNFVEAVADGQKAAFYMDRYLQNSKEKLDMLEITAADIKVAIPADVKKTSRRPIPIIPADERVMGFNEVVCEYSPEEAMTEAGRCLNCAGHLCKNVCPYESPRFQDSGSARIVKCTLCMDRTSLGDAPACVIACPVEAIDFGPMDELKAKYGGKREVEGFVDYLATSPSILFRSSDG